MSLKFTLQGIIQIGNVLVGVRTGRIGEPEAVGPGISVEIGQGQVLPDVWVMSQREPKDAEQIDEISNG